MAVTNYRNVALGNADVEIRAGRARLAWVTAYNPNATVAYVQVFDGLATDVEPGTTVPVCTLPVPATSAVTIPVDRICVTGLTVCASTATDGSGAPGTALIVNIGWG